ncbi:MAG TPA: 2-octaprenyl-6-methoxyphenyl hydroxylase [Arenimonas sp.]|uniref:2-octaprenyl-6-methoxyphenyl hydroxylase n=1 Tax=Arenimonas sp. TaxID=1872635 RepID=UPI002D7E32F8|nr:2-octaprenyl-6-methoxyphenyl hydroxylase [Arenimonas sp.]HEU0154079.1 2-octaprenyl-6-methoxyphenyl hydroxylase [Arenimonas sp.]
MAGTDGFDHDILILGGGLVGSALACALDGRGWRVAQVEASPPQAGAPGFDERKLALALASLNALSALDVLPRLATPPAPIRRIHVSRAGDFGSVRLAASDHGREQFGGVVLARELGQALESRLADCAGLVRYRPARVLSVAPDADGPGVTLEQDGGTRRLRTRLLVAADGSRSLARAAWGIDADEHDYGQTLVVCSLATDRAPDGTAYERFSEQGPVALLPMAGGHFGAICGVPRGDADAVLAMDDAAYRDYFQQRFGWRAGRVTRVGQRSGYPIARLVASRLTAPRGVVMGNAAQTLHPIGAQGFNLGLRDALTLAEVLAGDDPGAPAGLAAYEAARREDRERTLAFSDGLARITANPSAPLHVLRSLGLLALGHVPGLADPLVAGAMGFRGRVPALSRDRA